MNAGIFEKWLTDDLLPQGEETVKAATILSRRAEIITC